MKTNWQIRRRVTGSLLVILLFVAAGSSCKRRPDFPLPEARLKKEAARQNESRSKGAREVKQTIPRFLYDPI